MRYALLAALETTPGRVVQQLQRSSRNNTRPLTAHLESISCGRAPQPWTARDAVQKMPRQNL